MRGFAILVGFNLLGLILQRAARVPLPGNVIGLILFTACLFAGWVRVEAVDAAAGLLLRHMLLFFAPVVVGTIAFLELLGREWVSVTGGVLGSMVVVLLVTGRVATALSESGHARPDGRGETRHGGE